MDGSGQIAACGRSCEVDDYTVETFLKVAATFGSERYGFVVTPNADHLIRLHDDAIFRSLYQAASYVLLDSRLIAHIARFFGGRHLPVCTGSDLTARLLTEIIVPDDRVVLIGGNPAQAACLEQRYGFRLAHYNPPMGFLNKPEAVNDCLSFIEAHSPFRFCLLAVGSPQQEHLAKLLAQRGIARGMALCVGGSINFLTGVERRAPRWMQRVGLEWMFRLLQDPRRLAHRYLIRGPRVFGVLRRTGISVRQIVSFEQASSA